MFCKKVAIEFIASNQEMFDLAERPYPSVQNLPEWFGKMDRYINTHPDVDKYGDPNSTIKKCMPVVDIISAGYHIPLISDVWLDNGGENNLSFTWSWNEIELITLQKPEQHTSYPTPSGYYNSVFKWVNPWIIKTPPGWSTLFVHPQHHEELPFRALSALVDTDKHPAPVNLPFHVRKGFDGLIKRGTPIIQLIPFKREEFTASFSQDKDNVLKNIWTKAHTLFFERYQKHFWTPKKFSIEEKKTSKCPFSF